MTVENLHDAIGQLPSDLITETDRCRSGRRKIIPWQRYAAMAACVAMGLCASYGMTLLASTKGGAAPKTEMIMQDMTSIQAAPAEAAPMEAPAAAAPEEAIREAEIPTFAAAEDAPAAATGAHAHAPRPAESTEGEAGDWCGNMTAQIHWNGTNHSLSGTCAVTLTDILYSLPYSEANLCRCLPEFTVDTEMGEGYEISLSQHFVRYDGRQASLTEEQTAQIQEILDALNIANTIPGE